MRHSAAVRAERVADGRCRDCGAEVRRIQVCQVPGKIAADLATETEGEEMSAKDMPFIEGEITEESVGNLQHLIGEQRRQRAELTDPDTGEPMVMTNRKTGERYTAYLENGDFHLVPVDGGPETVFRGAHWTDDGSDDETDGNGCVTITFGDAPTPSAAR